MAVIGPRGPGFAHKEYKACDIQDLQHWQEKANEAVMVLEANFDIIGSLRRFYVGLKDLKDFPQELKLDCEEDIIAFISHLDNILYDFKMQISRARLLSGIIRDRKALVSLSRKDLGIPLTAFKDLAAFPRTGC
jgi:hypothetical protein